MLHLAAKVTKPKMVLDRQQCMHSHEQACRRMLWRLYEVVVRHRQCSKHTVGYWMCLDACQASQAIET